MPVFTYGIGKTTVRLSKYVVGEKFAACLKGAYYLCMP